MSEEQIVQLHEARRAMMEAVRGLVEQYRAGTITPDELEAGIEAARVDFEAAIQSILTAEQYAALLEFRRARLIEHLERRLGTFDQHVASRVATLDRILDLSDAQAADVQTILANTRPAMETVLAGLRDGSLSVLDAKEALRQLQADTDAAIRALLTPEQADLFDRLTAFRRHFPGCRP